VGNIVKYKMIGGCYRVKQFVKDLGVGDTVQSQFLVTEKALVSFNQPSRAGEQFLRMQLSDISGSIRAVVWDKGPEAARKFSIGDVVYVRGEVSEYRGLQLVVYHLEPVPAADVEKSQFQPVAPRGRGEMLDEMAKVLGSITNPYLARLMHEFFDERDFLEAFAEAPAARSVHHNYLGGLLQHSLEVAALCRKFLEFHPGLNASLLFSGALLHDIGKIEEYDCSGLSVELTTRGKLIGHIAIGKEMLDARIARVEGFPDNLRVELAHMLLSHHGQKEWGSPEVPKTFEAFTLFHADLVSARLNQFSLVVGRGSGSDSGWTDWDRLLERSVFLGLTGE
jgi:3'-5' exoribonuclease